VKIVILILTCLFSASLACASDNIVNVYVWSDMIPDSVIQQFEKETGIKVNFSTFDSNETMYAKLRVHQDVGYDIVQPSSYFVERMRKQGMLEKIDQTKIPNIKNLDPRFLNPAYDPHNEYSLPFIWGTTGIFVNKNYVDPKSIKKWSDVWDKKYKNQLMLLDDSREVFGIALIVLGYSINDTNPEHIKQAYLKLKELLPNIKLFNSDGEISIMVDEDAEIGMSWDGDFFKAKQENAGLTYIFPQDGFAMYVDSYAIPKDAPHLANAHRFLNFMLRADIAKEVFLSNHFASPNLAARKLLPPDVRNDPTIYPSSAVLRRGQMQNDIDDDALALYEKYWEQLKMGG